MLKCTEMCCKAPMWKCAAALGSPRPLSPHPCQQQPYPLPIPSAYWLVLAAVFPLNLPKCFPNPTRQPWPQAGDFRPLVPSRNSVFALLFPPGQHFRPPSAHWHTHPLMCPALYPLPLSPTPHFCGAQYWSSFTFISTFPTLPRLNDIP